MVVTSCRDDGASGAWGARDLPAVRPADHRPNPTDDHRHGANLTGNSGTVNAVVARIVAVVALALAGCGDDPEPLGAAADIAADDGEFRSGPDAGVAFARIAQLLEGAAARCEPDVDGGRCPAISAASGYAQVLAVRVLRCTAPGRFEARTAMLELVREVERLAPDDEVPSPPPLPDCS